MDSLVSVIIPVYNVKDYIAESIESICTQAYNNLEIILVDDGTKDNSIEIANDVLRKFDRKAIIIHQKNSGLPAARNSGLKVAKGDYVCFIDSDDIISENHIQNALQTITRSLYQVVYSDFEYTSEDNRNGRFAKFSGTEGYNRNQLFKLFSDRAIKIHCCSLLISTKLLKENNLWFNENLKYGEDVEFMWRLFSVSNGIEHAKQDSYKYLIRSNSIMSSPTFDKWDIFVSEFKETMSNLSRQYPSDKDTYVYVYNRTLLGLLHTVAKNTDLSSFIEFSNKMNCKRISNSLFRYGNLKTKIFAMLLLNQKLFYRIAHKQ